MKIQMKTELIILLLFSLGCVATAGAVSVLPSDESEVRGAVNGSLIN